jgi:very-short-patch-repair endonuclease
MTTLREEFFAEPDSVRLKHYNKWYNKDQLSWGEVAKLVGTYPNKVRRDATKLGVQSRDKREAQKVAISEGRNEHPTEGKTQSQETRAKISESQGKVWDGLTENERNDRSNIGKEAWNKKTPSERATFFKKSSEAIQQASRNGSKAENFLFEKLTQEGYRVDKHKEHILQNERLHIDLYVPSCRAAIEVDGPLHFEPVFGEDKLEKRQAADQQKNGLILSSGMVLIRVKLVKRESQRYMRELWSSVEEVLAKVKNKFPPEHERYFEV